MSEKGNILPSVLAGALAGVVATYLFLQVPSFQKYLPQTPSSNQSDLGTVDEPVTAESYEEASIQAVDKANPAVVSIVITKDVPVYEQYFDGVPNNPFGDFFGFSPFQIPQLRQKGTQQQEVGGGSGFLISADGTIVTNKHVVDQEDASYTVFLNDGTKKEAKVIARDSVNDIAVIKIDGSNLPFLEFADSGQIKVGQTVIAIGNALGEFENSVSRGVISGLSRSIQAGDPFGQSEQLEEVIQTDAAINPGNSGGPLIDLSGKVVGVNVAVAQGSENIGFSIPSNTVKAIVDSVQKTGKISRAYIGVRYVPITPALQKANNLPVDHGVLISRGEKAEDLAVIPGSPANKAGLLEGDIILEVDGQKLDDKTSLTHVISRKKAGDQVQLKVLSRGEEKTVTVTLEEAP